MKTKYAAAPLSLLLALMLFLSGCQHWLAPGASQANKAEDENAAAQESVSTVFPKDQVIDVKITIDEADFADMIDNAEAEEYKEASVEYNGQKLEHVGIRTKGNLSLRSVVNSDSDRYSFKLSFDEYVNQTLDGISKINLNNNYSDATYMREFLAYELAASAGLPTPGFSYVNVYINGELWGFYLAVEQIGDAYLERHFGNAYGALYKGVMTGAGSDLTWLGQDPDSYTGLEMKSKSSNDDVLIDMLDELNNGSDYEQVLDVDQALKYIALNVAASNMDSYLGMNKQNYYLYENKGVFSILPWDYNMAFGGFGGSNILIDEPTQGALAERPLVAKLLEADEYKERYHAILQDMLDGYLKQETFAKRVEELKTLISEHVRQDPRPFYTYEQYEEAIPALLSFVQQSSENIRQQLDGTLPSSGDGSGSGGGMGPGGLGGMRQGDAGGMLPGDGEENTGGAETSAANTLTAGSTADDGNAVPIPRVAAGEQTPELSQQQSRQEAQQESSLVTSLQSQQEGQLPQQSQQGAQQPSQEDAAGQGAVPGDAPVPDTDAQTGQPNANQEQPTNRFGEFGGGMGGGMPGGRGMRPQDWSRSQDQEEGNMQELIYTGISVLLLIAACLVVTLYKRKKL
ncbi:CotH kinase family protein [Paenibacillus ihbetae]|uniref:Spore coat protein CotH n=1 Tax=Paenibacillus ihbetae TaxID=1870820 RepID=A0ABX3JWW4_9BACL|nr:CotH kinase family protein [Paenibacillus ihbetae]OOC62151.1 spore coat protein CotH [Paenibacillus ihbetae]